MVIRPSRRRTRSLAALAGLVLAASACGGGAEGGGKSEETITLDFAASAGSSSMGLMASVIKGEGLDAKHGLNLQVREFSPDQAEQALMTGQVDAGFFGIVSLAKVRAEGRDLVFLAPLQTNHGAVIVPKDSPAKSLRDLKGHKVATLDPVSGLYTTMQVLAGELGMSWEHDFHILSGPPPALVAFIEKGQVDAIVHFEPNTSKLLASGKYRDVMDLSKAWEERTGEPLFMLGLAAKGSWVEDNPEAARRLTATIQEATKLMSTDEELVGKYLGKFDLDPKVVDIAKTRMSEIYISETPEQSADNARLILERAKELGIITKVPDPIFVKPGQTGGA